MKAFFVLSALMLLFVSTKAVVRFRIKNNYDETLWIEVIGYTIPVEPSGFVLEPQKQRTIEAPDKWGGQLWARNCDQETQKCDTGENPPLTSVEITLKYFNGPDYYDVSLVRGFNVPASIEPVDGKGDCETIGCEEDVNSKCPDALKLTDPEGEIVGCHSSCTKFNTNQYCCRGSYASARSCNPDKWEINSAKFFKDICPSARTYAYDRHNNPAKLTCSANEYIVTFG